MQPVPAIQILLVDHRPLLRTALAMLLASYPDFRLIGQAGSSEECLLLLGSQTPDVIITDIDLPSRLRGADWLRVLRARCPGVRLLVLTNNAETAAIRDALREGATSYLLRNVSAEELAEAIRAARHGARVLSPEAAQAIMQPREAQVLRADTLTAREREILGFMSLGWKNQRIANELNITVSTVQFHVSNILAKLHARNRTEAATMALRQDLLAQHNDWMVNG